MIRTSLTAIAIVAITVIGCGGGPTGDDNPRPPTPVCRTIDTAGNRECRMETGRQ